MSSRTGPGRPGHDGRQAHSRQAPQPAATTASPGRTLRASAAASASAVVAVDRLAIGRRRGHRTCAPASSCASAHRDRRCRARAANARRRRRTSSVRFCATSRASRRLAAQPVQDQEHVQRHHLEAAERRVRNIPLGIKARLPRRRHDLLVQRVRDLRGWRLCRGRRCVGTCRTGLLRNRVLRLALLHRWTSWFTGFAPRRKPLPERD